MNELHVQPPEDVPGLSWARFLPNIDWRPGRRRATDADVTQGASKRTRTDSMLSAGNNQPCHGSALATENGPATLHSDSTDEHSLPRTLGTAGLLCNGPLSSSLQCTAASASLVGTPSSLVGLLADFSSATDYFTGRKGDIWRLRGIKVQLSLWEISNLNTETGPVKVELHTAVDGDEIPEALLGELAALRLGAIVAIDTVRPAITPNAVPLLKGRLEDLHVQRRCPVNEAQFVERLRTRRWPDLELNYIPLCTLGTQQMDSCNVVGKVVAWEDYPMMSNLTITLTIQNDIAQCPMPTQDQITALFPDCTVNSCNVLQIHHNLTYLGPCCWKKALVHMASREDACRAISHGNLQLNGYALVAERCKASRPSRKLYLWDYSVSPPDEDVRLADCPVFWLDIPWALAALKRGMRLGDWLQIKRAKYRGNHNIGMPSCTSVIRIPEQHCLLQTLFLRQIHHLCHQQASQLTCSTSSVAVTGNIQPSMVMSENGGPAAHSAPGSEGDHHQVDDVLRTLAAAPNILILTGLPAHADDVAIQALLQPMNCNEEGVRVAPVVEMAFHGTALVAMQNGPAATKAAETDLVFNGYTLLLVHSQQAKHAVLTAVLAARHCNNMPPFPFASLLTQAQ